MTQHLNDAWLLVVAQDQPITQSEAFNLLVSVGKYMDCLPDKYSFDSCLRHLERKGFLRRKFVKGVFHYFYDDACLMRPVSGLRFTKAVEFGQWSIQ